MGTDGDDMNGPVSLEIGAFPPGVPGPWTHLLGDDGREVLIQSVTADGALFAESALGVDLSAGWAIVRGADADGTHPTRPPVAADTASDRPAAEARVRVYLAHQVREALDCLPAGQRPLAS